MSSVDERRRVFEQAHSNNEAALKNAIAIKDPWYRAQALAEVARYGPEKDIESVVRLAMKAARETEDEYRFVAVSAWPLAVLIARGHTSSAEKQLSSIIEASDRMESLVNKSDALILVFEAVYSLNSKSLQPILSRLTYCATAESGWHCARNLAVAVEYIARADIPVAESLANSIRKGHFRNQALRCIEACRNGEAPKLWMRFYSQYSENSD